MQGNQFHTIRCVYHEDISIPHKFLEVLPKVDSIESRPAIDVEGWLLYLGFQTKSSKFLWHTSCIQAEIFVMYFRLMAAIFELSVTLSSQSIHISPSVLLNTENVEVAVGISLLSCIRAEIFVIAYVLPRLMAAISDLPITLTSESIHINPQRVA